MLTLITVNFNNAAATEGLLRSLEQQTDKAFDIIVVDNASEPDDRAILGAYAAASPLHLDVIHSASNRGFSGGNNIAIRKALEQGSTWIVLINNDTTVTPDFVAQLRPSLQTSGIVGIPLDEGGRIAAAGTVRWFQRTLAHCSAPTADTAIHYAIGAGLAVHRSVFEQIGLLDEHFFLYFEDADFSLRAHHAGIPVHYVKTPRIRHAVSASTSVLGSPLLLRYHARNALLFNKKHGPWWVQAALPFWSLYGIVFQFLKVLLLPSKRAPSRAILDGIVDFYAQRFGKITPTTPYDRS